MKNMLRFGIITLAALSVFLMISCDDDANTNEGEGEKPVVVSVTIVPNPYTVHRGTTQTFLPDVRGTNDKTVIWSIDEQNVLHPDTVIDQDGKLAVSQDEENTSLTVRAVLAADQNKFGTAAVSVPAPTVTGVEISLADGIVIYPWSSSNKAINVGSGKTEQFLAKVAGENFPKQDVTWEISGTVPAGVSISEDGLLAVGAAVPQGSTFTVQAVSDIDPDKSDTIRVTVQPPVINFVSIVPGSTTITALIPVEFTVTVLGSGNIQGLYEIIWDVRRSDEDEHPLKRPGDEITYIDPNDGSIDKWFSLGTRFEGNTLIMTPDEDFGDIDDQTGEGELYVFTIDVTATVTSDLDFNDSVQKQRFISLTPELNFEASAE